jgi:hypothetical protein
MAQDTRIMPNKVMYKYVSTIYSQALMKIFTTSPLLSLFLLYSRINKSNNFRNKYPVCMVMLVIRPPEHRDKSKT